jgi:hypothetical protein
MVMDNRIRRIQRGVDIFLKPIFLLHRARVALRLAESNEDHKKSPLELGAFFMDTG